MKPIKVYSLKLFRKMKQQFQKISSITILILTCSGLLLVTETIQEMNYESMISFPEEINMGEVIIRTIAKKNTAICRLTVCY